MKNYEIIKDVFFFIAVLCLSIFLIGYSPKDKKLVDVYEIPPHFEQDTLYISVNGVLVPFYRDIYLDTTYKGKYFVTCLNGKSTYLTFTIDYDTYKNFKE